MTARPIRTAACALFPGDEGLTLASQRALIGNSLAPEFSEADIRQGQRPNGSTDPEGAEYRRMASSGFADYRLAVTGLVEASQSLSLAQLTGLHARPDHPARLRRGLELHRQVAGGAAGHGVEAGRPEGHGAPLPVANGAPLRLRVERQLGYKMAKYVHTIELVDSLAGLGIGRGSYWADRGHE